jgi:menaquinone-dependent protoporphyrinogen oxidase
MKSKSEKELMMSVSILVAYATRYGSTQEVAAVVAAILREGGREVDLQPMLEVQTLDGYGAVVLGAAVYIGKWHKEAHQFLLRHQKALRQRPVAVFALGPLHRDEREMQGARAKLDTELAQYPWLTPIALEMFIGRYDPARLRFPDSLIAKLPGTPLHGLPASDFRDWAAIRAWAKNLAVQLQPEVS